MAKTALLYVFPALLISSMWLRLEDPPTPGAEWAWMLVLALLPALARPVWLRAALAVGAAILAARSAFDLSLLDVRPWDSERDFLSALLGDFRSGFLSFYDVSLPYGGLGHPRMHGVVLLAIFGFALALGLAIAARRALVAALVVMLGAGWPATLLPGGNELGRGALILLGALILIVGLSVREGTVVARSAAAVGAVVLAALAASSSPAVAKSEFLDWQDWDFYTRPESPVGVRYVWNSTYDGMSFPDKRTTVLEIEAGPRPLYWRATTLDVFDGVRWVEDIDRLLRDVSDASVDPLLPDEARDSRRWIEHEVRVRALRDFHLVGGSVPVSYQWEPGALGRVLFGAGGVAIVPDGLDRDQSYRVWSYAPRPTPNELAASKPDYPEEIELGGFLNVMRGLEPPLFDEEEREEQVDRLFEDYGEIDPAIRPYRRLYDIARDVVGRPTTPYAAAVALEAWLRRGGGFAYDETPEQRPGVPPLVDFVTRGKRGYCQHYAGAMALMLRYLGIPARVAAGFTSGRYSEGVWTVTDHEAHTWVEVWFRGFGWLPFDPTPARGFLAAPYTTASQTFNPLGGGLFESVGELGLNAIQESRTGAADDRPALQGLGADRPDGSLASSAGDLVSKDRGESLLRFLAVLGLVLLTAIVVAKLGLRRSRFLTRNPRRIAGACRRDLADFLLDQGIRVSPSATLPELGRLLRDELRVDGSAFVAAATAARFAPPAESEAAAARARHELRQLERVIRRRLSTVERARGLLSLRSLGFAS